MRYQNAKIIPSKKRLFNSSYDLESYMGQNSDDVGIVAVSGYLKREGIKRLYNIINKNLKLGITHFILNLSQVEHINYKDVNLILDIKEKISRYKGEIKFVVKEPYIIDILVVGGWPFIWNFYPSDSSAIDAFKNEYSLIWR